MGRDHQTNQYKNHVGSCAPVYVVYTDLPIDACVGLGKIRVGEASSIAHQSFHHFLSFLFLQVTPSISPGISEFVDYVLSVPFPE